MPLSKYSSSDIRVSRPSGSIVRFLWKTLGFYLALVGLGLIGEAVID
ncbi:MAG TPA: hypothetical protein VFV61_01885 [Pyrinomonadaceae bacterium]|nr:hypothetical protein [Pyrinomonadaceae bacterium]